MSGTMSDHSAPDYCESNSRPSIRGWAIRERRWRRSCECSSWNLSTSERRLMEHRNVNPLTQRFSVSLFGDPGRYMRAIGLRRPHVSLPARL